MNIIQFLRILWARRFVVLACTVFTALGAVAVVLIVPPRYEATAHVILGLLKPDPVTGQAISSRDAGPYIDTQKELVKDYAVTGPVVDRLGWLTDPNKIAQYQSRPKDDSRDFRRWLAQQVADRTNAKLTSGMIYEISFSSPSPLEAKIGAEVLRQSYMDYTLQTKRQDAARNAQWYAQQAQQARLQADQAELAKAAFERENGIVMQSDGGDNVQDLESTRLAALVGQAAAAPAAVAPSVQSSSPAALQLAQIDAAIEQNGAKLGPNHPEMQQLRARRALVAKVVAEEQAAARNGSSTAAAVNAISRAVQAQKARVISQRDKVERLRQLQSEVDLRRDQYKKTAERAAQLSLEAGIADSGLTSLGIVVTPSKAAFPNKPLILGGGLALGAALGLALALLIELLNRRVRGVEDLEMDAGISCLAVIASAIPKKRATSRKVAPLIGEVSGASA